MKGGQKEFLKSLKIPIFDPNYIQHEVVLAVVRGKKFDFKIFFIHPIRKTTFITVRLP